MPRPFRLSFVALALCVFCGAAAAQAQAAPAPQSAASAAMERAQQAKSSAEVLSALGVPANAEPGRRVLLDVPDIAVAGRPFVVKVSSQLPGTDWILIVSERSPAPFVKLQEFPPGADRVASSELKLTQTGRVRAIVRSAGKYYQVSREIKIAAPVGGAR